MSQARRKILVVDDAGPVVILCVNVLQALGYTVKGANRGEPAIELINNETFDLLIVDYKMPGMNGFQVLEHARARHPDLMSILVTGHGTPEIMKEATKMGFDAILLKPFTSNELRGTVDQVLAAKESS